MQTSPNFAVSTVGKSLLAVIAVGIALSITINGVYGAGSNLLAMPSKISGFFYELSEFIGAALNGFGVGVGAVIQFLDKPLIGPFFQYFSEHEKALMGGGGHLVIMASLFLTEIFISAYHCIKIYRIALSRSISSEQMSDAVNHAKKAGSFTGVTMSVGLVLAALTLVSVVYRSAADPNFAQQVDVLLTFVSVLGALAYIRFHSVFVFPAFLLPREIVKFVNVQLKGNWGGSREPVQRLLLSVTYRYDLQKSTDAEDIAAVASYKPQGV